MANKMECPGCRSYGSDVLGAYEEGDPCPLCALPYSATYSVLQARRKAADADLTARFEELALRVGRAEAEARKYREMVERIREVLDQADDRGRMTA